MPAACNHLYNLLLLFICISLVILIKFFNITVNTVEWSPSVIANLSSLEFRIDAGRAYE